MELPSRTDYMLNKFGKSHAEFECAKGHAELGQCLPNTKIVKFKEITKYDRMDAEFYIKLMPTVKEFFKEHAVDNQGLIIKKRVPYEDKYIDKISGKSMVLLYSLIKHYTALESIRKNVHQMESELTNRKFSEAGL